MVSNHCRRSNYRITSAKLCLFSGVVMTYYAGIDCKCHARSEGDCSCAAGWTPTEVYRLRAQLVKAKADGIREAISDYKNKQPMLAENHFIVHALEHMKNYAYKLTNTTIDKG